MKNPLPINSVFANVYVSYYRDFADTEPVDISLFTLLNTEKHRVKIRELRSIANEGQQRAVKEKLPGFTVSARMKKKVTRSEKAIYRHSGFVCIDIDRKQNLYVANFFELKQQFKNLPFVACCKASCRGQGYFLVIPVEDPEKHEFYFNWLTLFFSDAGLQIDTSTSNPCAFRFVSWDENTYFNHQAERLKHYCQPPKADTREFIGNIDAEGERANVEYCIKEICRLKIDITEAPIKGKNKNVEGYTTWFYIGCCFAGTFGSEGKDYFHHVSQFYPKYNIDETNRQFQKCLQWHELKPGMKTFYDACKAFNILYKHRPGYVPPGIEKPKETNTKAMIEVKPPTAVLPPPGDCTAALEAYEKWLQGKPAGGVFEFEAKKYLVVKNYKTITHTV